ncbi:MAG: UDP-N-acetylmuramate dehydrogenase [Clostridia bacterium]|nr:UDP-N-acetylmuramate dehydrogenase [Clostridia bacterium]
MCFKNALSELTHVKILYDEPMKKHTGLGVGGCARYYAEIDSLFSLNRLLMLAKEFRVKYKAIGAGTNLLVSDLGFDGLIINTARLNDVFFKRDEVRVMAGAKLEKLIKFALDHRLTGLEALSGIPASVGGAVVMNAGAFGHNISEHLTSVETLDNGKIKIYDKDDCKFSYRSSRFLAKKEIVVSATFRLTAGEREIILAGIKTYTELRRSIQPTGRSCGSVFKNPKPYTAGALIDKLGLKGYSVGGATVSNKHGNFILTDQKAKAKDVYNLINFIKKKVKDEFGVDLYEEVEFVGEF